MKYWTYVEPTHDEDHIVTMSEKEILYRYFPEWFALMAKAGKNISLDVYTMEKMCLDDWITIHWATETDENGNEIKR